MLDWVWLQFLNSYELNWKIIAKYCVVIKIKILLLLLYYIIKIMYILVFIFFKIFPSSFSVYLLKIYSTKNAAEQSVQLLYTRYLPDYNHILNIQLLC